MTSLFCALYRAAALPPLYEISPVSFVILLAGTCLVLLVALLLLVFFLIFRRRSRQLADLQGDLRQAEETLARDTNLRDLNRRISATLESAPLLYVRCVDDKIAEVNAYGTQFVGMEPGRNISDFYEQSGLREKIMLELFTKGSITARIFSLHMRDGSINRFHMSFLFSTDQKTQSMVIWGVNLESTEHQRELLARSGIELQQVLDLAPVPMVILEPENYLIAYGNSAFLRAFHFENAEDAQGVSMRRFLPDTAHKNGERARRIQEFVNAINGSHRLDEMELDYVIPGDGLRHFRVAGGYMEYQGQPQIVAALLDCTKELQREEGLLGTAERERESHLAKSRFLVSMGRELQSPISAIASLSREGVAEGDPSARETYQKTNQSAHNLMSVLEDVLDYARIEAERLDLLPTSLSLADLTDSAVKDARARLDDREVALELELKPEVPATLVGDKVRLRQILRNILDSAAKRTEQGTVRLEVSLVTAMAEIWLLPRLLSATDRVWVCFTITDDGRHMTDEVLAQLFFSDCRDEAQASEIGLGLPIAQQMITLMNGDVRVESRSGQGTRMQIFIPLHRAAAPGEAEPSYALPDLLAEAGEAAEAESLSLFPQSSDWLDTVTALNRLAGRENILLKLLRCWAEDLPSPLLNAIDSKSLEQEVRTLRAIGANLGLLEIHQAAAALLPTVEEGDPQTLLYQSLMRAILRAKTEIEAL